MYLKFIAKSTGTFKFTKAVSYSIDNGLNWVELAANTNSPSIKKDGEILWKATLTPSPSGIGTFSSTDRFDVEGNVMSLIYGDNYNNQTSLPTTGTFSSLFKNATHLISASELQLPATTLTSTCYASMFQGCTSLTAAPELPATTLAGSCYQAMFRNCTSLTTAPELPATTLEGNCYYNMFQNCTSLTTAPSILPATTLASYCYSYMFQNCTSLTTAPELPATTLEGSCYAYMFQDCKSLTTAPELPATTLATYCYNNMFRGCSSLITAPVLPATTLVDRCYSNMFQGCTSLTYAPDLPATTLPDYCYSFMFNGCTNLNYIKAMFTTPPSSSYTSAWLSGVAASGTFVKNSAATWNVTGVNGVPTNWNILYGSPESYTYIDPTYLASYELLYNIMQDASSDICNNFILDENHNLYKSLIINNWKKTFPFTGEISFWQQMVNSNYINFTDSAYNSMFNNYYQWENISYVLNDYGDWSPYTAMQTDDTYSHDLIANINISGYNNYSYPQGALWVLSDFSILDFFEISSGERTFPRSGTVTYVNERNYNNISLFLISIYTYLALSTNYGDFGEIHIINEEYLNNITIDITKTIVSVPEYIEANSDKILRRITYNDYGNSNYTSNWVLNNNRFQSWEAFVNYISSDLKSNGYRILFPLILIENANIAYCSWVIEIPLSDPTTININTIQSAINKMYGNAYFINKTGFRIQGIYVSAEDWHYKENSLHNAPTKKKAYIHCTNGSWAPGS